MAFLIFFILLFLSSRSKVGLRNGVKRVIMLPKDVSSLAKHCSIASKVQRGSNWETLWTWGADENREKTLSKNAFVLTEDLSIEFDKAEHSMAAAVLKVGSLSST